MINELKQSWVDEFLTWDPEKFDNITKISIPTHWIWLPDIMVIEMVDVKKPPEDTYVYIDYNGSVFYSKPFQIKSTCNFNIYYFPFDQHNCSLTFTSWSHTSQDINVRLRIDNNMLKSFTSMFASDGEWEILNVVPSSKIMTYYNQSFGETLFYIIIKRKPVFYIVTLILPSLLLMILNIAGFYLPPESGERTAFKITLLLGYSVFLLVVSDSSPPSGTPLIGSYFVICMVLLVISVIECIFIVRIVHEKHFQRPVPKWLKTLVLKKMTKWLCLKDKDHFITLTTDESYVSEHKDSSTAILANYNAENIKNNDKQLSANQDSEVLLKILKGIVSIHEELKKNAEEFVTSDWIHVGYIIDIFFFRSYVIVVLVYTVSITVLWSQSALV
ncbi:5-hydroxytryptamine receptor 3A-like [Engystomops pustulosus]|uniref:5-hydroxytryptamine receptor 3A-like n=1 Tax=Engystomops pustulosus TaxID=76066 RepID=UPI003AFA4A3F